MNYRNPLIPALLFCIVIFSGCKKWSFNKIKGTYTGTWESHQQYDGNAFDTVLNGSVQVDDYDNKEHSFTISSDGFLYDQAYKYEYNKSNEYHYEKSDRVIVYDQKVIFKPESDSLTITINYTIVGGGPQSIIQRTFRGKK
jgi:hypothetical protein